jgi:hypothetical protein
MTTSDGDGEMKTLLLFMLVGSIASFAQWGNVLAKHGWSFNSLNPIPK